MRKSVAVISFFVLQLILGCANSEQKEFTEAERAAEAEELSQFFEREFQVDLQRSPMLQTRLGIKTDYGKWDNFSHLQ